MKNLTEQRVIEFGLVNIHILIRKIFFQVQQSDFRVDHVCCIIRGGMDFANTVSHLLYVPCAAMGAVHWPKKEKIETVKFSRHMVFLTPPDEVGKNFLLLDEMNDSGESLKGGKKKLESKFGKKIVVKTGVIHHKTCSEFKPDFIGETIYPNPEGKHPWIRYPWECKDILVEGRMERIEFIET